MVSKIQKRYQLLHEQLGGNAVTEVVGCFKKEFLETLSKLNSNLKAGSKEQIRFFAHRLKGSALNMGATRIYKLSSELERIAELSDRVSVKKISRIVGLIERNGQIVIRSLNSFLGERKAMASYDSAISR